MIVDVAIIGAGFAGCSTAWALARAGVRDVVVLERESELGRFASGRGAGLGRQLADDDDTTALTVRGAQLLRSTDTNLADAWTPTGGLLGFDDPAEINSYCQRAATFGVEVSSVSRADIVALWPQAARLDIAGGIAIPSDGVIDIKRLLPHYASSARIELGVEVTAVTPNRIETRNGGTISARVIVDASGAWAGQLIGVPPLDAFKRHLFVVEASAADLTPYLWHIGRREVYLRKAGDGVLTSPCDAFATRPDDLELDPSAHAVLVDLIGDMPIQRAWACVRSFTPERTMRIGRDPARPWLVWATALGGHGATASPAVGERAAAAVIEALDSR